VVVAVVNGGSCLRQASLRLVGQETLHTRVWALCVVDCKLALWRTLPATCDQPVVDPTTCTDKMATSTGAQTSGA